MGYLLVKSINDEYKIVPCDAIKPDGELLYKFNKNQKKLAEKVLKNLKRAQTQLE